MASEELVGKIARELNRKGWTCDGGLHEPGEYDTCADCRGLCKDMARAVLAVVEVERGWEYLATNPSYRRVGSTSEWAEMWRSRGYEIHRRHPAISASEWEVAPDGE